MRGRKKAGSRLVRGGFKISARSWFHLSRHLRQIANLLRDPLFDTQVKLRKLTEEDEIATEIINKGLE